MTWNDLRGAGRALRIRWNGGSSKGPVEAAIRCGVGSGFSYGGAIMSNDWKSEFRAVWDRGVGAWKAGRRTAATMFSAEDVAFLATIGCTAQELFDFVDDSLNYDDLDFDTALAVAEIRRDYFLNEMGGKLTGRVVAMSELPAKSDAVDGIAWLPRLIAKARIKLRGEMNPDLMYGCAGDRPFLRSHNLTLPSFLKIVRENGDNDRAIIDALKRASAGK